MKIMVREMSLIRGLGAPAKEMSFSHHLALFKDLSCLLLPTISRHFPLFPAKKMSQSLGASQYGRRSRGPGRVPRASPRQPGCTVEQTNHEPRPFPRPSGDSNESKRKPGQRVFHETRVTKHSFYVFHESRIKECTAALFVMGAPCEKKAELKVAEPKTEIRRPDRRARCEATACLPTIGRDGTAFLLPIQGFPAGCFPLGPALFCPLLPGIAR